MSMGLGLEPNDLKEGTGGENLEYMMKINYYPPCPRPDLALGVPAHTDMSALTLLVPNEVPGLQICKDGSWYDVDYVPDAIVVHIGDQVEVCSNNLMWVFINYIVDLCPRLVIRFSLDISLMQTLRNEYGILRGRS